MATATKQKKKHIKAVRPKLRLFRANEPLYSVLMWGINHSVSVRRRIRNGKMRNAGSSQQMICGLLLRKYYG